MVEESQRGHEIGGLLFTGSVLLGIVVGLWFNKVLIATLAGIGIGLILMALTRALFK